tara:strand:+ start:312 stop:503 length:192 start_codon:yes stop_codon:yes gene_type:complete
MGFSKGIGYGLLSIPVVIVVWFIMAMISPTLQEMGCFLLLIPFIAAGGGFLMPDESVVQKPPE